jgi:hypothetical protein
MASDHCATERLALEDDRKRFFALLSIVGGRCVPTEILHHIKAASLDWQRGDKALANLRLAFAGFPRLKDPSDAYRL